MNVGTEGATQRAAERGGHVVFLSYAHVDLEQAERLWKALELWGAPVWKDDRRLRAGERLDPAVRADIEQARAFLLLGTEASLESDYVDREIGWALEVEARLGGKFQVIPVRAGAGKKTLERAFGRDDGRLRAGLAEPVTATGEAPAAAEARAEAIRLYAAYRDGGGSPQQPTGRLVEVLCQLVAAGADPAALAGQLLPTGMFPEDLHPFRATLEALLRGHPADPEDPGRHYFDVVELRRLQAALRERLGQ